MFRLVVLVALLAVVAMPIAQAHAEPSPRLIQRVAEDIVMSVEFEDDFVMVGAPLRATGWFVEYATGAHPSAAVERVVAHGPQGARAEALVQMVEAGHFAFDLQLPERGAWSLEVTLASGERVRLPFAAYPSHPARLSWADDADEWFVQGTPARLAFRVSDEVVWSSAVARVEWWRNDRVGMIAAFELPLVVEAGGVVSGKHAFNEPGLYAVHVGSIERGLAPGDRPAFELYVEPSADAFPVVPAPVAAHAVGAQETPATGPAVFLLTLGACALLMRRR